MTEHARQDTKAKPIWVGIDAGGTFTDFVLFGHLRLETLKLLSTPAAPEQAILQGLEMLGVINASSSDTDSASANKDDHSPLLYIIHGSTIATNAALEGKGRHTAFITNEGFEDMLHLGRQARPELYQLTPKPNARSFPNTNMFGVATRRDANGKLQTPLTDAKIKRLVLEVGEREPQGIALNLLFSYLNGREEANLAEALAKEIPDAFITTSSTLLPHHGEYERGVAVWLNAWLGPLVTDYLLRLQRVLPAGGCAVMQSSGITLAADQAANQSVNLLLSGPAGGVAAAEYIAKNHQLPKLLTFDMGGTSTDVSLIAGNLSLTDSGFIGPYPVAVPMVNIHTIGAGGGSVASLDAVGVLQVGPKSAGAVPGPACYGAGGTEPTVTDANLILGLLVPERFLGGRMALDRQAAHAAVLKLARPMGLTVEEAANAIIQIANEHMVQALKLISLECGEDPRKFKLCCFGGAGGLHLCSLADSLDIDVAIVPAYGGVLSAFGMLVSSPGRQVSESIHRPLSQWDAPKLNGRFAALEASAGEALVAEGVDETKIVSERKLALRYQGQSHSLEVVWTNCKQVATDFVARHKNIHGFHLDQAIELVEVRVSLRGPAPPIKWPRSYRKKALSKHFSQTVGYGVIPVHDRQSLPIGEHIQGPVLIAEDTATTWVAPHWEFYRDEENNLQLHRLKQIDDDGEIPEIPDHLIFTT